MLVHQAHADAQAHTCEAHQQCADQAVHQARARAHARCCALCSAQTRMRMKLTLAAVFPAVRGQGCGLPKAGGGGGTHAAPFRMAGMPWT
eukprot:scaffold67963_cov19-Tisochrysis_lutea.AAC.1